MADYQAKGERYIGILTSGGDSPGMNPAVRAIVLAARKYGFKTMGINGGYRGLCAGDWRPLTPEDVEHIGRLGGTILRSARLPEFKEKELRARAIKEAKAAGIEGLIVIGGDGSLAGAQALSSEGLPCIGLPGTIDNDIVFSDYTIGYDTALNIIATMVDAIADTAFSHDRCMVIEVMGNQAGDLTLYGGIACNADAVLLLEETGFQEEEVFDEAKGKKALRFIPNEAEVERLNALVIERVRRAKAAGLSYFIILVAEGITGKKDGFGNTRYPGGVDAMAKAIEKATGAETRTQVLGYVQRGGIPTVRDRVLAAKMGGHAVQLLCEKKQNLVVIEHKNEITDMPINEALRLQREKAIGVNQGDYLSEKDRDLVKILSVAEKPNETGENA